MSEKDNRVILEEKRLIKKKKKKERIQCTLFPMSTPILCRGQEDPLEEGLTTHPVPSPRESHGQRNLAGYRPKSHKNFQQD